MAFSDSPVDHPPPPPFYKIAIAFLLPRHFKPLQHASLVSSACFSTRSCALGSARLPVPVDGPAFRRQNGRRKLRTKYAQDRNVPNDERVVRLSPCPGGNGIQFPLAVGQAYRETEKSPVPLDIRLTANEKLDTFSLRQAI
jgi:hypothetical protein